MKTLIKPLINNDCGNVKCAIVLDDRRPKSDGLFPIKFKVTHNAKRQYFAAGYDISVEDWLKLTDNKVKLSRHLSGLKTSLILGIDIYISIIEDLNRSEGFSFDLLDLRLSKGTINNVFDLFEEKVERLRKEEKIGTSEWYYYGSQQLLKYINNDRILNRKKTKKQQSQKVIYENTVLKFSEVTPDWLRKYEKWLIENGKKFTSISMYIRTLQAIFNDAKTVGIITDSQYPFGKGKFVRPEGEGRKLALSLDQIAKLYKVQLISKSESQSRDFWFFSYFANGMNINDMLRLKYSNINNNEITYYRAKTTAKSKIKKVISVELISETQAIIDRWGNPDKSIDNYIFPFFNNAHTAEDEKRITKSLIKRMNTQLQRISAQIGLPPISTYSARHSYATVLKRLGVSTPYISESLNHSDLKTTETYLDSFEREERVKNTLLLTKFKDLPE
jgi:integrase/recombinase XerD